jgi:hypothetical protein
VAPSSAASSSALAYALSEGLVALSAAYSTTTGVGGGGDPGCSSSSAAAATTPSAPVRAYRRVAGDGSCFYRALAFGVLEALALNPVAGGAARAYLRARLEGAWAAAEATFAGLTPGGEEGSAGAGGGGGGGGGGSADGGDLAVRPASGGSGSDGWDDDDAGGPDAGGDDGGDAQDHGGRRQRRRNGGAGGSAASARVHPLEQGRRGALLLMRLLDRIWYAPGAANDGDDEGAAAAVVAARLSPDDAAPARPPPAASADADDDPPGPLFLPDVERVLLASGSAASRARFNAVVHCLRLLTSWELRARAAEYGPFVAALGAEAGAVGVGAAGSAAAAATSATAAFFSSGLSVPAFCARRVEPMSADADNVQIAAAARALGVDVAVVDAASVVAAAGGGGAGGGGEGGGVLTLHPGGDTGPSLLRVWLVRLPGHYELLTALDPLAAAAVGGGADGDGGGGGGRRAAATMMMMMEEDGDDC